MKIESRPYYCPRCLTDHKVETNHTGIIYSGCRECGNSELYCDLPEAKLKMKARPSVEAMIVYYYFDVSNKFENKKYADLYCDLANKEGVEKFDVFSTRVGRRGLGADVKCLEKWNGKNVVIYDKDQFKGQYITEVGRLHDWYEMIYPNSRIKNGYYLVF